jgi:alpha-galactosidase
MSKNQNLSTVLLLFVIVFISFFLTFSVFGQDTSASYNELALKPPMGWNSWNTFYCGISEDKIKSVVDTIVSKGLKDVGYEYIVIDDCWQKSRGKDSVIVADSVNFPSGIKALADYIHSKGLKFGIYSDAGTQTCQGKPGSYNYEAIDAKTYAKWGVDYVKFDWCNTGGEDAKTQYTKMSKALDATGRPIVFSICEWGLSSPWLWASKVGNLWRATQDIQPCWSCTRTWGGMGWTIILDKVSGLSRYSGPGHWNDPDMLEVGNYGLTDVESQAHFSMWCMLAAPLMAGNDVRTMSAFTKSILTNKEMIDVDQDSLGIQGRRVKNDYSLEVWCKPLKDSSRAVTFFNRTGDDAKISIRWNQLGLLSSNASVRDLWLHSDLGLIKDSIEVTVPTHGVVVLKITGTIDHTKSLAFRTHNVTLKKGNSTFLVFDRKPYTDETELSITNQNIITSKQYDVNQYKITGTAIGTSKVIIKSIDGKLADTCLVTVEPSNIPAPWSFGYIGETIGFAFFQNDSFSIAASGKDIGINNDQCGFISQSILGDNTLSCRILAQDSTSSVAKSGIMFRNTSSIFSPFALLTVTPSNTLLFEYRLKDAKLAVTVPHGTINYPIYLKLQKIKTQFFAYTSIDGLMWTKVDSIDIPSFTQSHLLGLETVANNNHAINNAIFDNVIVVTDSLSLHSKTIDKGSSNTITVFPNPATDNISVRFNTNQIKENVSIQICSVDGRILLEKSIKDPEIQNQVSFSISSLSNGTYYVVIKNAESIEMTTFIVSKNK